MKDRCRQAASGAWYARATWTDPATGNRRYKHVSASTQTKCAAELVRVLAAGRAGSGDPASTMTLAAYIELWLDAKRDTVKTSSLNAYQGRLYRHIIPPLGAVRLHKLTTAMIQRAYSDLRSGGLSANAVSDVHRVLIMVLRSAERQGIVNRNPAAAVLSPRHRPAEVRAWSAAEAARFIAAVERDADFSLPLLLALHTGMRKGEVLALRWQDIDFDARIVRVRRTYSRGAFSDPKTPSSRRPIVLPESFLPLLRNHAAARPGHAPSHLVFSRADGSPLAVETMRLHFIEACRRADVPVITIHGLRHTHATVMLQAGVHPKIVQERLGHSTIAMTLDRYSHYINGMQDRAVEAFDATIRAETVQTLAKANENP